MATATEFEGRRYGDLLRASLDGQSTGASAAGTDFELPQVQTTDGRNITLVMFPDDVLSDEFNLTAIEHLPDGPVAVRLYDQSAIDRVAEMRAGDPALLNHGITLAELRARIADTPIAITQNKKNEEEKKEEEEKNEEEKKKKEEGEKEEDNSLQTEKEVKMATDPRIIQALSAMFVGPTFNKCPDVWQNRQEPITYPLADGRLVPAAMTVANCMFGNPFTNWLEFPIKESGQERRVCSLTFKFEDTKKIVFKEIQKSTKINFSYGIGLGNLPGLPAGGVSPKEGDPVYSKGELINAKFNFGLMRQYVKITLNAFHRLAFQVNEMQCMPRVPGKN